MTSTNGNGCAETFASTAHGAAARCIARTIVCGLEACEEAGPLSQLQRVAIVEAALLEFEGFGDHLSSLATVSRLLGDLLPPGPLHAA